MMHFMSVPIDHHFLPEFYLRRWTNAVDGQVIEFRRPYREVVWKRRYPSATGYQPRLYTIPSRSDAAERQEIESKVMSPLDSAAANAMSELESKGSVIGGDLRVGWARFLISLMYRSPRRVKGLQSKVRTLDTTNLEAGYAKRRGPSDPPTAAEFLAVADQSFHEESAGLLLTKLVSEGRSTIEFVTAMDWRLVQMRDQIHSVLTCDDPIIMSNGVGLPDGFMILPVGPNALFLATNNPGVARNFQRDWESPRASAALNDAICKNAWALVIGDDPRHLRFVERRLRLSNDVETDGLERNVWKAPSN